MDKIKGHPNNETMLAVCKYLIDLEHRIVSLEMKPEPSRKLALVCAGVTIGMALIVIFKFWRT